MDGNGRWAQSRGRSRIFGHIRGARVAKNMITECARLGISHLTLFAFST
jgi:undecaprenyl diphosphate synthase